MPNDSSQYLYLKIQLPSEQTTIIGKPWIDSQSITKHSKSRIKFIIEDVDTEDINKINLLLSANGYNAINWEIQ